MPDQKKWIVGSATDCDLCVPMLVVSAQHCSLTERGGKYFLGDLHSTNGTYVNGRRITGEVEVSEQDRITLGTTVRMPWPEADDSWYGQSITIGAAPENKIILDDSVVSAHHARLRRDRDGWWIEDLGSTNGTAVGRLENRIKTTRLEAEDVVFFGSLEVSAASLIPLEQEVPPQESDVRIEPEPMKSAGATLANRISRQLSGRQQRLLIGLAAIGAVVLAAWLLLSGRDHPDRQVSKNESMLSWGTEGEHPTASDDGASIESDSTLTADEFGKQHQEAVVWLGAEIEGFQAPLCAGWAIQPDTIVSTAHEIAELHQYFRAGEKIFAYVQSPSPRLIPVVAFRLHPKFSVEDPSDGQSLLYNLGLVKLQEPLPLACPAGKTQKLAGTLSEEKLLVIQYDLPPLTEFQPYDPLNPPAFKMGEVTVHGSKVLAGADGALPLLKIDPHGLRCTNGAPLFGTSGQVLGVVSHYNGETFAIPADNLQGLLDNDSAGSQFSHEQLATVDQNKGKPATSIIESLRKAVKQFGLEQQQWIGKIRRLREDLLEEFLTERNQTLASRQNVAKHRQKAAQWALGEYQSTELAKTSDLQDVPQILKRWERSRKIALETFLRL